MNETAIAVDAKTLKIRELNDRLRKSLFAPWLGDVVMTHTVAEMDDAKRMELVSKVQNFNEFTDDNDPHGEHDFGAIVQDGQTYYFKFDYYDPKKEQGSEAPEDPAVTCRVLTILHRDEY